MQKVVVVGAGPVGALAALYAAKRGDEVHIYELRDGKCTSYRCSFCLASRLIFHDILKSLRLISLGKTFLLVASQ